MIFFQPPNKRLFLNNCTLKTTKSGHKYYNFYTCLGKDMDIIGCKCWNMEHDMTKLKYIEKCVVELKGHKFNNQRYYELVIKSYAPPRIESWKVVQPSKIDKVLVNVNDELPPLEQFDDIGEKIIDTPTPEELVNNYETKK